MSSFNRSKSPVGHLGAHLDFLQPTLAEDLLKSSNYWSGSTETCRVCFKSLYETLKNQGLYLRELERMMNTKTSISEFHASLATKADFLEVSAKIAELKDAIDKKVTINDVELCINFSQKPGSDSNRGIFEKFESELKKKVEVKDYLDTVNSINSKIQIIMKKSDLQCRLSSEYEEKDEKNENKDQDFKEISKKFVKLEKRLEEVELVKENFLRSVNEEENLRFSFGNQVESLKEKEKILELIQKKVDFDKFQEQVMGIKTTVQGICIELNKKLENFHFTIQEQLSTRKKPFFMSDLEDYKEETNQKLVKIHEKLEILWKTKPEKSEIRAALHEINTKLHTKLAQYTKTVRFDIENPETTQKSSSLPSTLSQQLESLQKDLLLKASIKDLCTLLDMKANVEDINTALLGIHKELDCKYSTYPLGIWSFYSEKSSKLVFRPLKVSEFLFCELENGKFVVGKSGFFEVKVVVFSEVWENLQVLKNRETFLVAREGNRQGVGIGIYANVELLKGDVLEVAVPVGLGDARGNFVICEVLM